MLHVNFLLEVVLMLFFTCSFRFLPSTRKSSKSCSKSPVGPGGCSCGLAQGVDAGTPTSKIKKLQHLIFIDS